MRKWLWVAFVAFGIGMARSEPAKTVKLDKQSYSKAQELVGEMTAQVMDDYRSGKKSKVDVARENERLAADNKLSNEVRFILLAGAFNLYAELNRTDEALRIITEMAERYHYEHEGILSIMRNKRMDFGLECENDKCALRLNSILYRQRLVTVPGGKEMYACTTKLSNPAVPNETQQINVLASREGFSHPGFEDLTIKKYFAVQSKDVFQWEVRGSMPAVLQRDEVWKRLNRLCMFLNSEWRCGIKVTRCHAADALVEESLKGRHAVALADYRCGRMVANADLAIPIAKLRDEGVGPFRVDGCLWEGIHHNRILILTATEVRQVEKAWTEGGGSSVSPARSAVRFHDLPAVVDLQRKYLSGKTPDRAYGYACLGRLYEYGLCGLARDQMVAKKWYSKASYAGNEAAESHLKAGISSDFGPDVSEHDRWRVNHRNVYGVELSCLSFGIDHEDVSGYGVAPLINAFDDLVSKYDYAAGLRVGLIGPIMRCDSDVVSIGLLFSGGWECDVRGLQLAGLCNVFKGETSFSGVQIASFLNGGGGDVVSRGVQVGGIGNVFSRIYGVQIAGLMNRCCEASGVQISAVANWASRKIDHFTESVGQKSAADGHALIASGSGDVTGFQLALENFVEGRMCGVQVGLLNRAEYLSGVQIGVFNFVMKGPIKFFPIVNVGF